MALETSTPKPKTMWRSWDKIPGEDLVEMPRSLALDLIRLTTISPFIFDVSADDEEGCLSAEARYQAHQDKMEKTAQTISAHLCDEGLEPSADLMLRSLVMVYESAPGMTIGNA